MIDWLYQSTLDVSVIIALILLIRNPVRRFLGAHVSYWLWVLPLLRLFFSNKFERPEVLTTYLQVPESSDLIPVYSGPIQPSESYIELLALIWITGLIIWSLYKLYHAYKFNSLLHSYSEQIPTTQIMTAVWSEKFNSKIQFKYCSAVEGPMITGLIKPTIYLPKNFLTNYDETQRQHIIVHELTHAKRKDLWAQLVAEIFKAVYWFNPLIHIAWYKFQQDQELSCDHQVLKNADSQTRYQYGITLSKGLGAMLTPNSLTFFNHKHERFIMLSKHKSNGFITWSGLLIVFLIAYMMLTKTAVSFEPKNIENNGNIISYNFNNIPLEAVVMLVADAAGGNKKFHGIELLQGNLITADAERVYALDFLDQLLKDHGFKVQRQPDSWQFSKH